MRLIVGVDVGGSGVRSAVVVPDGTCGPICRVALADRRVETVVEAICAAAGGVGDRSATRVGVGVPGFVHHGVVLASPNFPEWKEVELQRILSERLGVPVAIENDANAASLGAWRELSRPDPLVLLTLGTGVGGGVVIGGRCLVGAHGTAGELGHLYAGGDAPCGCGGRGCLETWVGTVGLVARARQKGIEATDGAALLDDPRADPLWKDAAEALGRALVTLVNAFGPEVVVIAGGLTGAVRHLAGAEAFARQHAIPAAVADLRIVWGGRADAWAIVGAALGAG